MRVWILYSVYLVIPEPLVSDDATCTCSAASSVTGDGRCLVMSGIGPNPNSGSSTSEWWRQEEDGWAAEARGLEDIPIVCRHVERTRGEQERDGDLSCLLSKCDKLAHEAPAAD